MNPSSKVDDWDFCINFYLKEFSQEIKTFDKSESFNLQSNSLDSYYSPNLLDKFITWSSTRKSSS